VSCWSQRQSQFSVLQAFGITRRPLLAQSGRSYANNVA
jgi:hypothetical protein